MLDIQIPFTGASTGIFPLQGKVDVLATFNPLVTFPQVLVAGRYKTLHFYVQLISYEVLLYLPGYQGVLVGDVNDSLLVNPTTVLHQLT